MTQASDLHDFVFFGLQHLVDSADEIVSNFLHSILTMLEVVLGDFFLLSYLLELLDGEPAVIADGYAEFFRYFLHMFD